MKKYDEENVAVSNVGWCANVHEQQACMSAPNFLSFRATRFVTCLCVMDLTIYKISGSVYECDYTMKC